MLNIVIFGAPGSGKGTQSQKLIDKYHLMHISTGDILRSEIENQTELGEHAAKFMNRGKLVPDEMVIDILHELFIHKPAKVGYIFDGFPRTLEQGRALDDMLQRENENIKVVLSLEVDEAVLTERLIKRGEISGRNDDTAETIKSRLQVYNRQTAPLKEYYATQDKLVNINGMGTIDEIFTRIEKVVDRLDY
jgi:adenylate kinase